MESVSPITVITAEQIKLSGDTSVAEVMRNSSVNTFGSFRGQSGYGSGASSTSEVNLRGLGAGATLVLVDGRRLPGVGYDGGATQDLSMIPLAIVERIEILRDGASAIYGSDAVAGVINVITKKDFEGISFGASTESPKVDGGRKNKFDFAFGTSGDKGSIVFIAEHESVNEVEDAAVSGLYPDYGYSTFGPVARFQGEDGYSFNEDLCEQVPNTENVGAYCAYYYSNVTWLYGASEKDSMMTKMKYELTDDILLHSRFSAVKTSNHSRYAPTPVSTSTISIDADNAMNPYGEDGLVRYRTATQGNRDSYTDKVTFESVFGVEGTTEFLNSDWDWELFYQFTNASEDVRNENLVNDVVFQELVNSEALDLFNVQDLGYQEWLDFNDAALAESNHNGYYQVSQKRHILDGNFGGELYSNGDVTVSMVAGFEYSKLDFTQTSDTESGQGIISGGSGGDDVFAERERRSYYAEIGLELPYDLEFSGALRYDGYKLEGDTGGQLESSEFSDTVPKLGLSWRPTDNILARISWGEAFRAPTMSQLYASRSFGFPTAVDKYFCETLGNNTNPAETGFYCAPSGVQILTWNGGNPSLQPENSESTTAGIVYDITDNLSVELSYYKYDYTNKIESISLNTILELDVDGNNPNVIRLPDGKIDYVNSGYANLAVNETSGYDLTVNYSIPTTDIGTFTINTELSKVNEFLSSTPGEEAFDYAGYVSSSPQNFPDKRGNINLGWSLGDLTVAWRTLYIGKSDRLAYDSMAAAPSYFKHNVQASYDFDYVTVAAGVKNLTDKTLYFWPGEWRGFDSSNYDPLGRTVYLNLNTKF
jgi:outer membrane receptor protein involved in Fe transport